MVVKITDFGSSKLVVDGTALRSEVGTQSYMAPEIIGLLGDHQVYSNAVDMWSLGCLVYAIVTGETLFPHPPFQHIRGYIGDERSLAGLAKGSEYPAAMNLIMSLINPKPDLRLTTKQALKHHWVYVDQEEDLGVKIGKSH